MSAKFPRGGGGGSRTFFSSKSIRKLSRGHVRCNFIHELTAYLTWAKVVEKTWRKEKVGEKIFHLRVKSLISVSGVHEIAFF